MKKLNKLINPLIKQPVIIKKEHIPDDNPEYDWGHNVPRYDSNDLKYE